MEAKMCSNAHNLRTDWPIGAVLDSLGSSQPKEGLCNEKYMVREGILKRKKTRKRMSIQCVW